MELNITFTIITDNIKITNLLLNEQYATTNFGHYHKKQIKLASKLFTRAVDQVT